MKVKDRVLWQSCSTFARMYVRLKTFQQSSLYVVLCSSWTAEWGSPTSAGTSSVASISLQNTWVLSSTTCSAAISRSAAANSSNCKTQDIQKLFFYKIAKQLERSMEAAFFRKCTHFKNRNMLHRSMRMHPWGVRSKWSRNRTFLRPMLKSEMKRYDKNVSSVLGTGSWV